MAPTPPRSSLLGAGRRLTAGAASCIAGAASCAVALALLGGCSNGSDAGEPSSTGGEGRFTVVTDIYPTSYAVSRVAGTAVEIVQLVPAGVEPHDYKLSPNQVAQVADADLVLHLPGVVPAVAEAIEQEARDRAVDISSGITRRSIGTAEDAAPDDPHVWLNPQNMALMGANAAAALAPMGVTLDTATLNAEMSELDGEFQAALTTCRVKSMVVSHAAFGYLADAYGFEQVAISGLSPESEPSPAKLAEITALVEQQDVTTVYFESLASPEATQTIAAETGAATALLDPVESDTDEKGYPAIMRANKDSLHQGQSCP